MKKLLLVLPFLIQTAFAEQTLECRRLNPDNYQVLEGKVHSCITTKNDYSESNGNWNIEYVLHPEKDLAIWNDGIKKECRPTFDKENRMRFLACKDGMAMLFQDNCTDANRFYGAATYGAGYVTDAGKVVAPYLAECRLR